MSCHVSRTRTWRTSYPKTEAKKQKKIFEIHSVKLVADKPCVNLDPNRVFLAVMLCICTATIGLPIVCKYPVI